MKRQALIALIFLVLASLACSINVDAPDINIPDIDISRTAQVGPTETFTVNEPAATADSVTELSLELGAGRLTINPGAAGLIEGSIAYNVTDWKPELDRQGNSLRLHQDMNDNLNFNENTKNDWDLKLGETSPIELTLKAGAYQAEIDLSGVPLTNLAITDGASDTRVEFNELNPEKMTRLSYRTGASQVELVGLGYANVSDIVFESGAGNYTLDFAGELQEDTNVSIKSGVSQVTIIVPNGMHARVTNEAALTNVDLDGTWDTSGNTYETDGEGPLLNIDVNMGIGNLVLVYE